MVNPPDDVVREAPSLIRRQLAWFHAVSAGHPALRVLGVILITVFVVWVGVSFTRKPLPRAVPAQTAYDQHRVTNILLEPFIGLDFHHNYRGVKTWRADRNPYVALSEDPANLQYVYPPLTLVAFSWVDLFPSGKTFTMTAPNGRRTVFGVSVAAILIWFGASVGILGFSAWQSWRCRAELGLPLVPWPFILGATLLSYPVLFELERGNCNVLPLLATAVLISCLRSGGAHRAWVIGLCVAVAVGIKPFAIVLLPGLIVLRQLRAAAWAVAWLVLQAVLLSPELQSWAGIAAVHNETETPVYMDWSHSVISHWRLAWTQLGVTRMTDWPAQLTVGGVLVAACAVVAWPVLKAPAAMRAAWPFLLWLLAVGTMLLPIAHDYNLLFVPLLLACTWRARDPWWIHLLGALAVLWLQPFYFGVTALPLLLLKSVSVISLGAFVVRRVRELPADATPMSPGSPLAPNL